MEHQNSSNKNEIYQEPQVDTTHVFNNGNV